MAKAIRQIEKIQSSAQEEQAQDIAVILKQISENREAITSSLEILNELQNSGVLNILKGVLKAREKAAAIALEQINQPSMHNTIKNGFNAFEFLGTLDPEKLKIILNGISKGLDETSDMNGKNESISVWGMMKSIRDPDVNAALIFMMGFLKGMGKEIEKGHTH
jgi:uncharacterized protein YjgD (DUF1641 family)